MVSKSDAYLILGSLKKDFDTFGKAIKGTERLLRKEMVKNPKNNEVIKILCDQLSSYRENGGAILDEISKIQQQIFKGA